MGADQGRPPGPDRRRATAPRPRAAGAGHRPAGRAARAQVRPPAPAVRAARGRVPAQGALAGPDFRIDFAYPDLGVAIEVDGYEKRATRAAFQHDTERQTALAALGWTVLRFTWHDVVRRPAYVAGTVEAVVVDRGRVGAGGRP
ncbi:MAG TPA: DUF559 domain-containing protein [Acidimicrobiales bacterium]|nr:DUF559 domain-containing protein [Acidimicrobiales bacterium]